MEGGTSHDGSFDSSLPLFWVGNEEEWEKVAGDAEKVRQYADTKVHELIDHIETLTAEAKMTAINTEERLNALERTYLATRTDYDNLSEQHAHTKKKLHELELKEEHVRQENSRLTLTNSKLETHNASLSTSLEELKQTHSQTIKLLADKSQQFTTLSGKYSDFTNIQRSLSDKLRNSESENFDLASENSDLKIEVAKLKSAQSENNVISELTTEQIKNRDEQIAELKRELEQTTHSLTQENETLDHRVQLMLESEKKNLAEIKRLEKINWDQGLQTRTEKESADRQIRQLVIEGETKDKIIQCYERNVETAETEAKEAKNALQDLEKRLRNVVNKKEDVEEENKKLKKNLSELNAELALVGREGWEIDEEAQNLINEDEENLNKYEKLLRKWILERQQKRNLQDQFDKLLREIEEKAPVIKKWKEENEKWRKKKEIMAEHMEKLMRENQLLAAQIEIGEEELENSREIYIARKENASQKYFENESEEQRKKWKIVGIKLDNALNEIIKLREERAEAVKKVEGLVRQREMYKSLLASSGTLPANIPTSHSFTSEGTAAEHEEREEAELMRKQRVLELEAIIEKNKEEKEKIQIENGSLKWQIDYVGQRTKSLEEKEQSLRSENSEIRGKLFELEKRSGELEREIVNIGNQLADSKKLVVQRTADVEKARADANKWRELAEHESTSRETLSRTLQTSEKTVTDLTQLLSSERSANIKERDIMRNEIEQWKSSAIDSESIANAARLETDEARKEARLEREKRDIAETKSLESAREAVHITIEKNRLLHEIEMLKKTVDISGSKLKEIEQLQGPDGISSLKRQNDELKEESKELNSLLDEWKDKYLKQSEEFNKFQEIYDKFKFDIDGKLDLLKEEKNILLLENQQLKEKSLLVDNLRDQINILQSDLDYNLEQVNSLEKELQISNLRIDELLSDLGKERIGRGDDNRVLLSVKDLLGNEKNKRISFENKSVEIENKLNELQNKLNESLETIKEQQTRNKDLSEQYELLWNENERISSDLRKSNLLNQTLSSISSSSSSSTSMSDIEMENNEISVRLKEVEELRELIKKIKTRADVLEMTVMSERAEKDRVKERNEILILRNNELRSELSQFVDLAKNQSKLQHTLSPPSSSTSTSTPRTPSSSTSTSTSTYSKSPKAVMMAINEEMTSLTLLKESNELLRAEQQDLLNQLRSVERERDDKSKQVLDVNKQQSTLKSLLQVKQGEIDILNKEVKEWKIKVENIFDKFKTKLHTQELESQIVSLQKEKEDALAEEAIKLDKLRKGIRSWKAAFDKKNEEFKRLNEELKKLNEDLLTKNEIIRSSQIDFETQIGEHVQKYTLLQKEFDVKHASLLKYQLRLKQAIDQIKKLKAALTAAQAAQAAQATPSTPSTPSSTTTTSTTSGIKGTTPTVSSAVKESPQQTMIVGKSPVGGGTAPVAVPAGTPPVAGLVRRKRKRTDSVGEAAPGAAPEVKSGEQETNKRTKIEEVAAAPTPVSVPPQQPSPAALPAQPTAQPVPTHIQDVQQVQQPPQVQQVQQPVQVQVPEQVQEKEQVQEQVQEQAAAGTGTVVDKMETDESAECARTLDEDHVRELVPKGPRKPLPADFIASSSSPSPSPAPTQAAPTVPTPSSPPLQQTPQKQEEQPSSSTASQLSAQTPPPQSPQTSTAAPSAGTFLTPVGVTRKRKAEQPGSGGAPFKINRSAIRSIAQDSDVPQMPDPLLATHPSSAPESEAQTEEKKDDQRPPDGQGST